MSMKEKIEKILRDARVSFEFIPLPEDLPPDVPSHMKFYGDTMQHALATMIYKTEKGFIAVSRRGDTKVSSKKLREALGVNRLSLATKENMAELGLTPGIVPPLGLTIPLYMDKKLLEVDYFYDGTGHKLFGLKMKTADLLRVSRATVGDFTVYEESYAKQRIFSGVRPTNLLHIGNYLGAVKGMIALQNDLKYETYYCVVDLHAITTPYGKNAFTQATREVVKDYLAAGLDPSRSAIFVQSHVPEHVELGYLLSTVTTLAKLTHLPTYKEKVKQYPDHVTMALVNYPVLMAADILAYKCGLVPVGVDQEPHLEAAREIARRMNQDYGTDFPQPQRFATKGENVPSLTGEGKMSKSVEGSYIALTDDLQTVMSKLAKAPTDAGGPGRVPDRGPVANLFKFLELFLPHRLEYYGGRYEQGKIKYSEVKEELARAIYAELEPIQKRRRKLTDEYIDQVIADGAKKARAVASQTVLEVKQKMGLLI